MPTPTEVTTVPQPNHLLRAVRERTPSRRRLGTYMSREEVADLVVQWLAARNQGRDVAFDANHLGKLERGIIVRPRDHYITALCAVLEASAVELGFAHPCVGAPPPRATVLSAPEEWELIDAITRSAISMETLDAMERATFGYAKQYPSTPPRALLASVSRQLARVKAALDKSQRLRVRQHCVVLLGVLSGLAGNLWFDLGRDDRAAGFFKVGMLSGQESDDSDLTAWLLATQSIIPFFAGRYGEAADLLTRAEDAAVRSSARRRAWIASLRARAAAASGDRGQSIAAMDRAGHHMCEVSEPPAGTDFFDAPRLEGLAGSTHMLMGDTARAVPLLVRALNRRAAEDAKGRALLTLDLAQCHAMAREPEEAARLANEALDATRGTLVDAILTRARVVRTVLTAWSDLPTVREIDARLAELNSGR